MAVHVDRVSAEAQRAPSFYPVGRGEAFGWPGLEPRWASGAKQGVGTACSGGSRVWFTIAEGVLTEIFYPHVDTPSTRDLQFLVTDGEAFFHEERRDLQHTVSYAERDAPAYLVASADPRGDYLLAKVVVSDPDADAVVMHVRFMPLTARAERYRLFLLFAPHVKNRGYGNSARILASGRRRFLVASREDITTAVAASVPFRKASAGFVGYSDGWQDLHDNFQMDWEFAYDRYVREPRHSALQIWRLTLPLSNLTAGERLRLQLDAPAVIHWSADRWATTRDSRTEPTGLGVHYFEFPPEAYEGSDVVFTFYWPEGDGWEGRDYVVSVRR